MQLTKMSLSLTLAGFLSLTACEKKNESPPLSKTSEATTTAQCSKDTDCKGDRICDKGVCTAPNPTIATTKTEAKPTIAEQKTPASPITATPAKTDTTTAIVTTATVPTATRPKLPFIGEKAFNFAGGNGTEESVKINKDGTTIVMLNGTQSSQVTYKGKYQNPIPIEGGKYYYRLDGDHHITMLNADKSISQECEDIKGNQKECREELY